MGELDDDDDFYENEEEGADESNEENYDGGVSMDQADLFCAEWFVEGINYIQNTAKKY